MTCYGQNIPGRPLPTNIAKNKNHARCVGVIAPASAFAQFGGTFGEYYESQVEPSRLYRDNCCIQLQAARCLIDECGAEDDSATLPPNVSWR
jgi:hypothetical protein